MTPPASLIEKLLTTGSASTARAPGDYAGLTVAQAQLLSLLRHCQVEGYTPSYEEMKEHMGFKSKSGVFRIIDALEERGYAARMRNRARSIEVFPQRRMHVSVKNLTLVELLDEMARRGIRVSLA